MGTRLLEAATNARFYAWIRVAAAVLGLTKAAELLVYHRAPAAEVLPWVALLLVFAAGVVPFVTGLLVVGLGAHLLVDEYNNHFYTLLLVLGLVALSESRAAFAWRATPQVLAPAWPAALMRLQVSIIYVFAGLAKLNSDWLSGDVLAFHYERAMVELPTTPVLTVPLAVAVPAIEVFAGLAVWSSRWRNTAFGVLLPLHVGMLSISNSLAAVYGIGVFAPISFLLVQAWAIPEAQRMVVWDDSCTFCRKWVRLFTALDVFRGLRFVGSSSAEAYDGTGVTPEAADNAMQFVAADGAVQSGFAALRCIVHALPFGFLVSPWFALPGVRHVGDRAYAAVAARRSCRLEEAPEHIGMAR